jgi:hypothetical protein
MSVTNRTTLLLYTLLEKSDGNKSAFAVQLGLNFLDWEVAY